MTITWEAAGGTHVGRLRSGNEDSLHSDPARGIFLVADGMGGHAAGEVASGLVAQTVSRSVAEACDGGCREEALLEALREAVRAAHERIVRYSTRRPGSKGLGTTLTACVLDPAGICRVVHVGDSRLYRLRQGSLQQLTLDHTWVQREVDAGRLDPSAARKHPLSHILTRVLTDDPDLPEIDLLTEPVLAGDLLVLMTDGLYNMLDDDAVREIVVQETSLEGRVALLIDAANRAGGADNITAVLVQVS